MRFGFDFLMGIVVGTATGLGTNNVELGAAAGSAMFFIALLLGTVANELREIREILSRKYLDQPFRHTAFQKHHVT